MPATADPTRHVSSRFTAEVHEQADIVVSVAVSSALPIADEQLDVTVDGEPQAVTELRDDLGSRFHEITSVPVGSLTVSYRATVDGPGEIPAGGELDRIVGLHPSRYCPSDVMAAIATSEFGDVDPARAPLAVAARVAAALTYDGTETRPTDSALETWLRRAGVCRDYAHVTITFLRALGIPARLASAYAPGLSPMDFHAVAEAHVAGEWQVVDATGLAPRSAMVRIATGRDAADTAFLSVHRGRVDLGDMEVGAIIEPDLPVDDSTSTTGLR